MSSEIIPNSIISFISAQLTQILGVLITTGKPAKWRPELDGENGNANTGSRNRVMSRLSARFPVLNVPVLLLNLKLMSTRHTGSRFARQVVQKLRVTTKGGWRCGRIESIQRESNDSSQLMSIRHNGSRFARRLYQWQVESTRANRVDSSILNTPI